MEAGWNKLPSITKDLIKILSYDVIKTIKSFKEFLEKKKPAKSPLIRHETAISDVQKDWVRALGSNPSDKQR